MPAGFRAQLARKPAEVELNRSADTAGGVMSDPRVPHDLLESLVRHAVEILVYLYQG